MPCMVAFSSLNTFLMQQVYGYQGIKKGTSSEQLLGSFVADLDTKTLEAPLVIGVSVLLNASCFGHAGNFSILCLPAL